MAIWQYDLLFRPRHSDTFPNSMFDQMLPFLAGLSELIPWMSAMRSWGNEEGHRVDCVFEVDGSFELTARVDVRATDDGFIERVCRIADALDSDLLDIDGRFVPGDCAEIRAVAASVYELRWKTIRPPADH